MLTISKLKRWSISYYIDTAAAADRATRDRQSAGGGLGEYYSEKEQLDRQMLVVVDEAGMVGTDDLRQLLTATTTAGVKTVLVGDAHQLAPVKARGGMFNQLSTDLPWTQHLSEVWRMRNPEERVASLALRDGGPEPARKAIDWYRDHDRLRCGDPIAMAADALAGYQRDVAVGKDALLLCDTTEMADALNRRIHDDTISAPTVTGARGHRLAKGDLILTRRNDPSIDVWEARDKDVAADPVRNGHRWRVAAVNPATGWIVVERLTDNARAVFDADYVSEHVTHGYATTVHSAQGVTADTTHAVLSENTTRALLYVAMTRGREANTAYLYERVTEAEYGLAQPDGPHVLQRGTGQQAGLLVRAIIASHDDIPTTAHDVAAHTTEAALPERVRNLMKRRHAANSARQSSYQSWQADTRAYTQARDQARDRHTSRGRVAASGYDLEL